MIEFSGYGVECVLDGFIAGYVHGETFGCAVGIRNSGLQSCDRFFCPAHIPATANEDMVCHRGLEQCLCDLEALRYISV